MTVRERIGTILIVLSALIWLVVDGLQITITSIGRFISLSLFSCGLVMLFLPSKIP